VELVLPAARAILLKFQPLLVISTILLGRIVALAAFIACQRDDDPVSFFGSHGSILSFEF
jgi:hypothetical protein